MSLMAGLSIVLYCSVSISVVFMNRYLFYDTNRSPVFVSWCQQVIGLLLYCFIALIGTRFRTFSCLPVVRFDRKVAKTILPASLAFVGMVGFSNICLKYVQVSTYQVARSSTLLFTLGLSSVVLGTRTSCQSWVACCIVIIGFIYSSFDSQTLSFSGAVAGVISSFFQAIYYVAIKLSMRQIKDSNVIVFYNLAISSVCFIPFVCLTEWKTDSSIDDFDFARKGLFKSIILLIISGTLGLGLTVASYLCIQNTSVTTFNVVGYIKACVQTSGGILLLNESYSFHSITGVVLTLTGSFWYSYMQHTVPVVDRDISTKKSQ